MEDEARSRLAFELASMQLAEQLNGADSDDVKSLGYLGVDVAGAAAIFAGHTGLNSLWPTYVAGYAIAALLLMIALRSTTYLTGPTPVEIYFDNSPTPRLDATLALTAARSAVHRKRLGARRNVYRASIAMTIVTTAGSALGLSLVH